MTYALNSSGRSGRATVARLGNELNARLNPVIPNAKRFALLDFPDHDNVGDSAIFVGTTDYLDRRGLRPAYISRHDTFDEATFKAFVGDGPILMHGGGNFGDLWPWFHPFRESIIERFPGRPIIQLPQSIHYDDMTNADRTARLIERHGAFTLIVRDHESLAFARAKFACETILCPDMAFCMEAPVIRSTPTHDLLLHLRKDKEAGSGRAQDRLPIGNDVLQADWPAERADFSRRTKYAAIFDGVVRGRGFSREALIQHLYRRRARARFNRGADLLTSAKRVLTDRLHGHIMSLILGVPHVVLDNSYGKNSRFIKTWDTCSEEGAYLATDMDDALRHLRIT